jgi:ABC-type oligopeptide transport system substrate-binding subunit
LLNPPLDFPVNGLDPAVVNHISDDMLAQQLFDGLLQYRPVTFELTPALAEKWETPDSGRTWIFHLRQKAFFNDDACFADGRGRAVTAEDVKYSLERIIAWRENGNAWRVFADIEGAEDFRAGRAATTRGIQVRADSTLAITLTKHSYGIRLEVEFLPKPEHFAAARAGRLDFFRSGWICDYPDALDLFQLFYSASPNNDARYSNPEYDRLFEHASRETNRGQRLLLFEQMENILLDDCPAIYMLHEIHAVAIPAYVHNMEWSINPVRMRFLKYVWLEPSRMP